jgi:hypothetical protein
MSLLLNYSELNQCSIKKEKTSRVCLFVIMHKGNVGRKRECWEKRREACKTRGVAEI